MAPHSVRKLLFVVAAIVGFATGGIAQSGRRSAPKPTPPPSAPTESSSSNPTESTSKKATQIQVLVGIDDPSPLTGVPRYFADTVLDVCAHRLSEPSGVSVTAGPHMLTRADAVKAAKAETIRYVVWLQVGNSSADAGRQVSSSANDFYVNFVLLEPATAKIKQSGHVSGGRRAGNVGVGVPSSRNTIYLEQVIRDEAQQAAERILSALGIKDTDWPRASTSAREL